MYSARQLGISEKEYEEALAVEKLFFLTSKEKCGYCGIGRVTHVDTYNCEFYCSNCAHRGRNKKKIGEDIISYYDVLKLEDKFGNKNYKYEKKISNHSGRHAWHRSSSKFRNKHPSYRRKYETSSESTEFDSEYERARREREKEKRRKKHEKEREKERERERERKKEREREKKKEREREKERMREKEEEKEKQKEKLKKKKKVEDMHDDFDNISISSYDESTPGMKGLMKSYNKNNKKSSNSFANFDYKNKKKVSSSSFADLSMGHTNRGNCNLDNNMPNVMTSGNGYGPCTSPTHGPYQFDPFYTENVEYGNFGEVPNNAAANMGYYTKDVNNMYWNKVGNAGANFNIQPLPQQQQQQQQQRQQRQQRNMPFFTDRQCHANDFNYFCNTNMTNMYEGYNNEVDGLDAYMGRKMNTMPGSKFDMDNEDAFYNYGSMKNSRSFNDRMNLNNESDEMNAKNGIYHSFPDHPNLSNNTNNNNLNRNMNNMRNGPLHANSYNFLNYGNQDAAFDKFKRSNSYEYGAANNTSDISTYNMADKNPFSLKNLISTKNVNRRNGITGGTPVNKYFDGFNCNRNIMRPTNSTAYGTCRQF